MANNEDSNSNGLDSFDAVKQRFKDRSKVQHQIRFSPFLMFLFCSNFVDFDFVDQLFLILTESCSDERVVV